MPEDSYAFRLYKREGISSFVMREAQHYNG
jgi:hypothetical protein